MFTPLGYSQLNFASASCNRVSAAPSCGMVGRARTVWVIWVLKAFESAWGAGQGG